MTDNKEKKQKTDGSELSKTDIKKQHSPLAEFRDVKSEKVFIISIE